MNQIIEINNQDVTFEQNENGIAFTDSLTLAKVFGKEHRNVTRDIENLPKDEFSLLNFEQSKYQNERGKYYKMYKLSKKGLMLIAMGLTGEKAHQWKTQYIEAFEALEKHYHDYKEPVMLNPTAPHTLRLKKQPMGTYTAQSRELIKDLDLAFNMGYAYTHNIRPLIANLVKKELLSEPLTNAEHYSSAYYLTADQARAVVHHSLCKTKDEALAHLYYIFKAEDEAEEANLLDFIEEEV